MTWFHQWYSVLYQGIQRDLNLIKRYKMVKHSIFILLILLSFNAFSEPKTIYYPDLWHGEYVVQQLKNALSYSDEFTAQRSGTNFPNSRNFYLMQKGESIDVLWAATTKTRESEYLPIRIPLVKGMLGIRIALVHRDNLNIFDNIKTVEDLKKISLGQSHQWIDGLILMTNQLNVTSASNPDALFKMLGLKRFDAFPRAIVEILSELKRYQNLPIAMDQNTAIHYPTAMYFFVNKQNLALYKTIKLGLEKSIKDGRFDQIFNQHYLADLNQFNLEKRNIILLENPLLPESTPLNRDELWLLKPRLN